MSGDDTGPTFVESSGTANNSYRLSLEKRVGCASRNPGSTARETRSNTSRVKSTVRIFIVASQQFTSAPVGKVQAYLFHRSSAQRSIVRDVKIFINPRSRGGASPWHFLDQTSGQRILAEHGRRSPSGEKRDTLLSTRFRLVQSRDFCH